MLKCAFCQNTGELHEVEAPAIRLCTQCREKLNTHIAVVCTGCDTLHWLPKTPGNVQTASEMSGIPMQELMEGCCIHQIKSCRQCYTGVQDYVKSVMFH